MIELGKNGSSFWIQGKDNIKPRYRWQIGELLNYMAGASVDFKGFHCIITNVDKNRESFQLMLVTNDPNDYIPIVI